MCVALAATGSASAEYTDFITGKGLPNRNPVVVPNWGKLPAGRNWGSKADIDIAPIDGHISTYERCGASSFGEGTSVQC